MSNSKKLKAALEGLLFVLGDEGISIDQITYVLGVTHDIALEVINELIDEYEDDSRGLRLTKLAGLYKITTKPIHHEFFVKLLENPTSNSLSQAALETLAIIAYNQPITRVGIEQIRGVNADGMVRKLLAFALIKEVGRLESPGRPVLYGVTNEFLDYFNLSSVDELPPLSDFQEEDVLEEADLFLSNQKTKEEIISE